MSRTRQPGQLDLFVLHAKGPGDDRPSRRTIAPAPVPEQLHAIAAHLPEGVRLGTSSWSFPGWTGLVYANEASQPRLARDGLAAYAQHPLLRTVGIDRSYYAPLSNEVLATHAAAVPAGFRFLMKAHELCTIDRFPRHERYGAQRGTRNSLFLDPGYATDTVVQPFIAGLEQTGGPLLFQFPPQDIASLSGPARFAERLHTFLRALPRGPLYAVEIRNAELLTPLYVDALVDASASHCLNAHPTMPPLATQAHVAQRALTRAEVIRWMLPRGLGYDEARERYRPFNRIVDDDPATRDAVAERCVTAARTGRPALVIINNKAEGSAPLSVFRLAARIVERLEPSTTTR